MKLLHKLKSLGRRLLARSWTSKLAESNIAMRIDYLESQLKDVQDLALETIDQTGGPGWTSTIQSAVAHLDDRLDDHQEVLIQHEKNFESIVEEEERIQAPGLKPKSHLN